MKLKVWSAGALVLMSLALPALAQEKKAAPAPSADEKAMMEAWMKSATPNENHKALEPMVGTFNSHVKSWMAPGAPPMESDGVSTNSWVLGGRYVQMSFKGTFMNMPYEGLGFTGYDNMKKQYISSWMDNMSTWPMTSSGSFDAKAKTMTLSSMAPDPMTGKDMPVTEKLVVTDNDHHVMEMWGPGPDGKNFKMMEITYARAK